MRRLPPGAPYLLFAAVFTLIVCRGLMAATVNAAIIIPAVAAVALTIKGLTVRK